MAGTSLTLLPAKHGGDGHHHAVCAMSRIQQVIEAGFMTEYHRTRLNNFWTEIPVRANQTWRVAKEHRL
jgi:hypothetical protein